MRFRKVLSNKLIMVTGALISFLTLAFLFSSCGFMGAGKQGSFQVASQGGPGDGETPTLGPRLLRDNPQLAEEDCEDNERCKEACREIYPDSYKKCYDITIQQVSDIENVFYALVNAEKEELDDIDDDHLEDYLKIGLDSFRDRVIYKLGDRYPRFSNILDWFVRAEKVVVPLLEKEDPDNEIFEQLVRGYCDVENHGRCANADSANPSANSESPYDKNFPTGSCALKTTATKPTLENIFPSGSPGCSDSDSSAPYFCPALSSSHFEKYSILHALNAVTGVVSESKRVFTYGNGNTQNAKVGIVFDYANDGGLYYCSFEEEASASSPCSSGPPPKCTTLTHKKLAEIDDDDNRDLFMSLVGIGEVFFNEAAGSIKTSAFALGHKLLEKACTNSKTSLTQCMSVFYCWLDNHAHAEPDPTNPVDIKSFLDNNDLQEKIELDEDDLKGCIYDDGSDDGSDDDFEEL